MVIEVYELALPMSQLALIAMWCVLIYSESDGPCRWASGLWLQCAVFSYIIFSESYLIACTCTSHDLICLSLLGMRIFHLRYENWITIWWRQISNFLLYEGMCAYVPISALVALVEIEGLLAQVIGLPGLLQISWLLGCLSEYF